MTLSLLAAALLSNGLASVALSDDDEHEHRSSRRSCADVAPVTNATYQEECSACHMAYQPGLLPAQSWEAILDPLALADHYGDDATLGEAARAEIAGYFLSHAADESDRFRSRAFAVGEASQGGGLPRITVTRYFRRKHHEIPDRLVSGNPDVASFSQCDVCHRTANDGVYNEHKVVIPGAGRWED